MSGVDQRMPRRGFSLSGLSRTPTMSFEIDKLELPIAAVTAIVGPNGAGKSTLLRVLAGLEQSDARVEFDAVNLAELKPVERARLVSYLPQQLQANLAYSVIEVVTTGRFAWQDEQQRGDLIMASLAAFDLVELAQRRITELSGGELARIFLARAHCQDALGAIYDEPLAALDLAAQQLFANQIRLAADRGRAVALVVHDLNLAAEIADHVVLLNRGRVVATGRPSQVFTEELISANFGHRVRVIEHPLSGKPLISNQLSS